MNQKELVREMREMHEEQLQQLRTLTDVMLKLVENGLVLQGADATIGNSRRTSSTAGNINAPTGVTMDESVFVTQVDTSGLEKSFSQIAETKTEEDQKLQSNLSKLRALKKGE